MTAGSLSAVRSSPGAAVRTDLGPLPITVVHAGLGHGGALAGGSERQLILFLEACDLHRWSPRLLLSSTACDPSAKARLEDLGVPVHQLVGDPLRKLGQLRRDMSASGARLLLSWSSYTNVYGVGTRGMRVPVVGSFRGSGFQDLPSRMHGLWSWLSAASVDAIVCNSPGTAMTVQRAAAGTPVRVVPNAVEPVRSSADARVAWRTRLGVSEDELLVLGIGSLRPEKNFMRFLRTVALARQRVPLRAAIAGPDHGDGPRLVRAMRELGLADGTVRLLGPVPSGGELLCAADLFLLTSDHEGMPNVVLEAMAAGVPVVSTPVNGLDGLLLSGVNGLVAEPDHESLAEAVVDLVTDAGRRRRMGHHAAAHVTERYAPERVYGPLWQFLREMVLSSTT